MRLRLSFRLNASPMALEFSHVETDPLHPHYGTAPVNLHRFAETINGRAYQIEVSNVGRDQWRAQIVRVPGGSTATMPFYGKTPDEAAHHLSRWLSLAHGQSRSQL